MVHEKIFPSVVKEVLDYVRSGPLFEGVYRSAIPEGYGFRDINRALENYKNQDVDKPLYFLPDIVSDAAGEIPVVPKDAELLDLKYQLIEYEEQEDFYQILFKRLKGLKKEIPLKEAQLKLIANMVSDDLYYCAKARLLMKDGHPFFERMFEVYKNQGLPCGWRGGRVWGKGDFLIYSRH